jgi:hypothetical protein
MYTDIWEFGYRSNSRFWPVVLRCAAFRRRSVSLRLVSMRSDTIWGNNNVIGTLCASPTCRLPVSLCRRGKFVALTLMRRQWRTPAKNYRRACTFSVSKWSYASRQPYRQSGRCFNSAVRLAGLCPVNSQEPSAVTLPSEYRSSTSKGSDEKHQGHLFSSKFKRFIYLGNYMAASENQCIYSYKSDSFLCQYWIWAVSFIDDTIAHSQCPQESPNRRGLCPSTAELACLSHEGIH